MTGLIIKFLTSVCATFFKYFIFISFVLASLLYSYFLSKLPDIKAVKISIGFIEALLCSYIFYFIVIFFPQYLRIKHIKKVTLIAYHDFKQEIIFHLCGMSNQYIADLEPLFTPATFRKYFPNDKWDQVANALYDNKGFMKEWQLNARFLRDEIMFLLNAVEHTDDKAFTSLKELCRRLQKLELISLHDDYEEQKSLMLFFWEFFAGYSFVSGYTEYDHIKRTITRL